MSKYKQVKCRGFWVSDLNKPPTKVNILDVIVSPDSWDEVEDAEDMRIFFYTDGEPIVEGMVLDIDSGFVITSAEEVTNEGTI